MNHIRILGISIILLIYSCKQDIENNDFLFKNATTATYTISSTNPTLKDTLIMQITDDVWLDWDNQLKLRYEFANNNYWEETGYKFNDSLVWIHPIRGNGYELLELTPFPLYKKNLSNVFFYEEITIGSGWNEWTSEKISSIYFQSKCENCLDIFPELLKQTDEVFEVNSFSVSKIDTVYYKYYYCDRLGFFHNKYSFKNLKKDISITLNTINKK